jgi:small subunit ribosomal protein S16
MLKIRLQRLGRKKHASYRVVVMESLSKRNGRPVDFLGFYNPNTKQLKLSDSKIKLWVNNGAKMTNTVAYLLKKKSNISS